MGSINHQGRENRKGNLPNTKKKPQQTPSQKALTDAALGKKKGS
jgi:hypothetical protein